MIAEVVYVLERVYKVKKQDTVQAVSNFLAQNNIRMGTDQSFTIQALRYYEEKNIDFIDGYLCALKDQYNIKTFDKKLLKCLNS